MRFIIPIILWSLLITNIAQAQSYSVEMVPSPKTASADRWVADPNDYIDVNSEQILESKLDAIEKSTSAEVTLVVLPDVSGGNPHDFGVKLFNTWGVGKKERDNGLLILLVMNQRRVEFITGYGMEITLPDLQCYQIQQEFMVPRFKAGDYAAGLIDGIDAVAREIVGERWQSTPTAREKESIQPLLDSLAPQLKTGVYLYGLDKGLADSTQEQLTQQATVLRDSLGLELYFVAWAEDLGVPAQKVAAAIAQQWESKQDNNLSDYLLVYHNIPQATTACAFKAMNFKNQLDRETADYLALQLNEQFAQQDWMAGYQKGLGLLNKELKSGELYQKAQAYFKAIQQEELEQKRQMLEELKQARIAAQRWFYLQFLFYYLGALAVLMGFAMLFYAIAEYVEKNPYQKYHLLTFFVFSIWMFIFPIPYIWVRRFFLKRREAYRHAPRNSKKNGMPMRMMSEKEEDRYLKGGQITEERINSIHYDVWITEDESDILILPYKTIFSKYRTCIKCQWRTYYLVYNRTIRAATTSSSGLGEKKYACKHCNHIHQYTYVIPKKSESSSSSSSSGGSFGGGSSGGGGAGSSW